MAWGRKQGVGVGAVGEIENILGASSEVRGDLKSERGFRIDGKIEGNVESGGPVVIGERGHVQGNLRGTDVIVVGKVVGNVVATGHLDIGASGSVVGDVTAKSMRIETGGVLRGTSAMGPDEVDTDDAEESEPSARASTVTAPAN